MLNGLVNSQKVNVLPGREQQSDCGRADAGAGGYEAVVCGAARGAAGRAARAQAAAAHQLQAVCEAQLVAVVRHVAGPRHLRQDEHHRGNTPHRSH